MDPQTDTDPNADAVIALFRFYFFPARRFRDLMVEAKDRYDDAPTAEEHDQIFQTELIVFMAQFIASLFPLCEGFRKLGLKDPTVDPLIAELMGALRSASKAVFTYVDDKDYKHQIGRLMNAPKRPDMNTVEKLYLAFDAYFGALHQLS